MKNTSLVSIIIASWNGLEDLKISLPSINLQTYKNIEVLLVDNGSTDNTIEYAKKTIKGIKIIKLNTNNGFAIPNNKGYQLSKGKYILTLNNDIELLPNFIEKAVNFLDNSSKEIYAINTKMLFFNNKKKINTIGIGILKNGNGFNLGKGENEKNYNNIKEIFGPCAGAAFYKKEVIEELGYLFDKTYFAYLEDLDLAIRAKLKGYKAVYFPDSICLHKHGNTSKRFPLKKYFLIERNRLRNLIKYYPIKNIIFEFYYTLEFIYKGFKNNKSGKNKIDKQQKAILKNIFGLLWIIIKARVIIFIELPKLLKFRFKQKNLIVLKKYLDEK